MPKLGRAFRPLEGFREDVLHVRSLTIVAVLVCLDDCRVRSRDLRLGRRNGRALRFGFALSLLGGNLGLLGFLTLYGSAFCLA